MATVYIAVFNGKNPSSTEESIHIAVANERIAKASPPKKYEVLRSNPREFLCGQDVNEFVDINREVYFDVLDDLTNQIARQYFCQECIKKYDEIT